MNQQNQSTDQDHVADQNVERLIREGYRPETLDADFISRVQEQVLAAAAEERDARRPSASNDSPLTASPPISLMTAGWGVAILLLIGVILWPNLRRPDAPSSIERDGEVVWIDGKPYVAESSLNNPLPGTDLEPLDEMLVGFNPGGRKYNVSPGLVARERPAQAKPPAAKIGDEIKTADSEQRRLTLPDGSVLFVDQNTHAKLVGEREVEVTQGEVFVEVAPKILSDDTRGTFLVKTNERTVTALGTKFGVRTGESPRVLVTQGKVEVSDADKALTAGQQFVFDGDEPVIEAAPRADVALDWMRDLVVAAEGALIPANEKAGGDLIAVDPDGQDVKLSLRKYHIDVHIEDGFARTTIDQTYFNHMWSRLEGTFYFPLPPDASLSRLAMYVGPKLMEGGMAERDYARQVFETIKHRQLDPALLEWVDGSTFKMRVFPLEPRQEKRIIMSYTQKLDISYGRTRYRFPAGHNMKVVNEWSVKLRVKDGRGLLWDSPSHTLAAENEGRDLVLTAEEKLSRLDKDVVLFLNDDSIVKADVGRNATPVGRNSIPSRADRKSALLSTTTHEDSQYLMLRWRPQLPTEKVRQRRDWVFLFESSADRSPLLARTQIEVIRTVLNHAEHDDTFAIVSAGSYTDAFDTQPRHVSPDNIAAAMKYLEQTHLVGGLDVEKAFRSLATFTNNAESPVIVHVGSGTPILGEREVEPLVQALPQGAQYVGVGVGKRYNRSLMKQAAARSGGYFTQINPDESTSWRGFELVSALNTPRLLDIRIETDSGACQMLSFQDSLAHGEELTAIGRYEKESAAPSELTVSGQLDGQPFTQKVPVEKVQKSTGPLPRMWAKQQIELLTSLGAEEHKDRIIKLSKAMYVMSPFTSLLVLENDEMYEQYKIDRGRKDHWALYPAPETIEVVEEKGEEKDEGRGAKSEEGEETEEGEEKGEEGDESAPTKPSASDVLSTVLVHRPAPVLYWPNHGYRNAHTTSVWQVMNNAYGWPASMDYTNANYYGWYDEFSVSGVEPTISLSNGQQWFTPLASTFTIDVSGRLNVNANGTLPIATGGIRLIDSSQSMGLNFQNGRWLNGSRGTNGVIVLSDGDWNGDGLSHLYDSYAFFGQLPRDNDRNGILDARWMELGTYTFHRDFVLGGRPLIKGLSTYDIDLDQVRSPKGGQLLELYRPRGVGSGAAEFDELIDLIVATVRPDVWEDVGGPGTVGNFPGNLSLVISQTQTPHDVMWGGIAVGGGGVAMGSGPFGEGWDAQDGWNPHWAFVNPPGDGGFYYTPGRLGGTPGYLPAFPGLRTRFRGEWNKQLGAVQYGIPSDYRRLVSSYYRTLTEDETESSLIRRAYLDLAGEFSGKELDFYLRHGGEIDGKYWLDVARYGDTLLPSPSYMLDDAQYMVPGHEFGLTEEAAALQTFVEERRAKAPHNKRRPPWEIDPTPEMRKKISDLIGDIKDPEITITVDPRKPRRVDLKTPFSKASVSNNGVAAVRRIDADSIELSGYAQGITTLTVEYPSESDEPEVLRYLVRVAVDDDQMQAFVDELETYLERVESLRERRRQALASYVLARTEGRVGNPDVFYQRPQFTGGNDLFSRLISYAPGLNTSSADVYAILEAEADVALPIRGSVDAGAKRLIERARSLGWQRITFPGEKPFTLAANGAGQYVYERQTRFGLHETVLCDGESLRHHYEEIGLGATRKLSRFHREQFAAMVPWAVPRANDLALGADVRLVNENTVALVPRFAEIGVGHLQTHLVFAADGRLAERQIVAKPDGDVLLRVTYSPDGKVTWIDGDGKELHKRKLQAEAIDAPNLKPDESQLVMLPAPLRSRDYVVSKANHTDGENFRNLSEEAALQLIASHGYSRTWETMQVIGQRFFAQGDRRLGFYTLLLSSYGQWNPQDDVKVADDITVRFDPLQDHPDAPLAKYIASQLRYQQVGHEEDPPKLAGKEDGFLQQLAEFRRQYVRWSSGRAQEGSSTRRLRAAEDAVSFVERLDSPEFRWCLLELIDAHRINNNPVRQRVSQAYGQLTDDPALGHLARFEYGKALYAVEDYAKAREVYTRWYKDTRATGMLPRINDDFYRGMTWDGSEKWNAMLRETAQELIEQGRRPTAMTLAWQVRQLGDASLANDLAAIALDEVAEVDQFAVKLSGVEYFATTGQRRRALVLLETLLSDEETAELSMLWRLGSSIAGNQQMTARSAKMLEQALAIEYGSLKSDDVVNLEQLRNDYGELLNRYDQLATALATLEAEPSPALVSRLISVADRWRSMEDDVGLPCNRVASIFSTIGAEELAWQYVTTPLAARPNEAAPWLDLASNMKAEENYAMADKAYREAFKSEGTNAEILWQHAAMLKELGRHEDARGILKQITTTTWQPRFQHIKSQAEEALKN